MSLIYFWLRCAALVDCRNRRCKQTDQYWHRISLDISGDGRDSAKTGGGTLPRLHCARKPSFADVASQRVAIQKAFAVISAELAPAT